MEPVHGATASVRSLGVWAAAAGLSIALFGGPVMSAETSAELDALWDYAKPAESEARFRERLARGDLSQDARLETETQLARALGLQGRYAEAHARLDAVERELGAASALVRARFHLERGRVLRSSGDPGAARPEFERALAVADGAGLEFFCADALHMLALVAPPAERVAAHRAAIARTEQLADPRARRWLGPLHNNLAWEHHDRGEYAEALAAFERAVPLFEARGDAREIRIARWSVARAQRSLGRCEEALETQRALLAELSTAGEEDGFVHEELAECLLATGRAGEARPHFREAHRLLSSDAQLARDEPARIARLEELGHEK
jgi:tetratricopeptide (TPR) repeat protein